MRSGAMHYLLCNSYSIKYYVLYITVARKFLLIEWIKIHSWKSRALAVSINESSDLSRILWLSSGKLEYEVIIKVILRYKRVFRDDHSTQVPWSHLEHQLNSFQVGLFPIVLSFLGFYAMASEDLIFTIVISRMPSYSYSIRTLIWIKQGTVRLTFMENVWDVCIRRKCFLYKI